MNVPEAQRFLRRVDWNLFRLFYEIAKSGSLSAAARQLNMHQPSLSSALKRLEDHLGLALCRRTARGIELTSAGKALMQLSTEMVETVRLAPHLTAQAAQKIEGVLSIRMVSNIICERFDEALFSFNHRHPNVEIKIRVSPWHEVLDALAVGECDVGVSHDNEPKPSLNYLALMSENHQAYCGRSHPLFGIKLREPASLEREKFIIPGSDEPEEIARFRERYRLGRNPAGHAADLGEASRMIALGIGIGFLPTIVAKQLMGQKLWPILADAALPSLKIYFITPPTTRISTPAQLFFEEVRRRNRAALL